MKKNSISVFFPCYNDEKTIAQLVNNAFDILAKLSPDFEVIVINDCSTDDSAQVLSNLKKIHTKLKIITNKKNLGYGGALKSGFKASQKELIFYTDGDGQYDVLELPLLLSLMTPDINFVNGIKMERQDAQYRIFFGNLHKFITRWAFWLPVYDVDCDFRLIRSSLVKKLNLKSNSGSICVELIKKAERGGGKFREVSVHHFERRWGQSQFFHPNKIFKTYFDLGLLWLDLMIFSPPSQTRVFKTRMKRSKFNEEKD